MTGAMLAAIEDVLLREKPDWALLYGDTNSTMAGALAAVKLRIPVAHVEAGGRLGTLTNPEEVNRIVTDHVSSLLFAPTDVEMEHLKEEGLESKAYVVGNIMYDSYLYASSAAVSKPVPEITGLDRKTVRIPERYYYLTCHRQENTYDDTPLTEILKAMEQLDAPTIYPVHPRNQERAVRLCARYGFSHIILTQPVGYMESVWLLKNCEKVVTDSGGLQCEAFYAGKQCVTIFDRVVWSQTMVGNRNQISKADAREILDKLSRRQEIDPSYQPFGDGHTAERIIDILERQIG